MLSEKVLKKKGLRQKKKKSCTMIPENFSLYKVIIQYQMNLDYYFFLDLQSMIYLWFM